MSQLSQAFDPAGSGTALDAFSLLARWNYSLAAFYLRRWQRQLELPLKLAQTASPADLVDVRRAFEADLMADYSDQADALQHACGGSFDEAREGDYGAVLLKAQVDARDLLEQAKAQADRIVAAARVEAETITAGAITGRGTRRVAG
jgi:hypothetical protein